VGSASKKDQTGAGTKDVEVSQVCVWGGGGCCKRGEQDVVGGAQSCMCAWDYMTAHQFHSPVIHYAYVFLLMSWTRREGCRLLRLRNQGHSSGSLQWLTPVALISKFVKTRVLTLPAPMRWLTPVAHSSGTDLQVRENESFDIACIYEVAHSSDFDLQAVKTRVLTSPALMRETKPQGLYRRHTSVLSGLQG